MLSKIRMYYWNFMYKRNANGRTPWGTDRRPGKDVVTMVIMGSHGLSTCLFRYEFFLFFLQEGGVVVVSGSKANAFPEVKWGQSLNMELSWPLFVHLRNAVCGGSDLVSQHLMSYFTSSDFSFLFCKIKSIVLKNLPCWLNIIYVAIWEVAGNTKTPWVEFWLPHCLCGALDKLPPCFCIITVPTEEIHHEDYTSLHRQVIVT